MKHKTQLLGLLFAAFALLSLAACNKTGSTLSGSKVTATNYDQVTLGMSKAQVETIMGPPTSSETKDMVIFKKTTFRYEEGAKFAVIEFKNDEVNKKDGNLREP
ncbi:MAG: outer membrane protein assembly factor BamE domain-containing protein [Chthoniobacterales bacterium]